MSARNHVNALLASPFWEYIDRQSVQEEVANLTDAELGRLVHIANHSNAIIMRLGTRIASVSDSAASLLDKGYSVNNARRLKALYLLNFARSRLSTAFGHPFAITTNLVRGIDRENILINDIYRSALATGFDDEPVPIGWLQRLESGHRFSALSLLWQFAQPLSVPLQKILLETKTRDKLPWDAIEKSKMLAGSTLTDGSFRTELQRMMTDRDETTALCGVIALGWRDFADKQVVIRSFLASPARRDDWALLEGATLFAYYGPTATNAAKYLQDALSRIQSDFSPGDVTRGEGMERSLRLSLNTRMAGRVAYALWRINQRSSPQIVEAMTRVLDTGEASEVRHALIGLGEIGYEARASLRVVRRYEHSEWHALRALATKAVAAIKVERPATTP